MIERYLKQNLTVITDIKCCNKYGNRIQTFGSETTFMVVELMEWDKPAYVEVIDKFGEINEARQEYVNPKTYTDLPHITLGGGSVFCDIPVEDGFMYRFHEFGYDGTEYIETLIMKNRKLVKFKPRKIPKSWLTKTVK